MKLLLPRIVDTWCLEFDCWPKDHPGCARRDKQGCKGCKYAIEKTILDGSDESNIDMTDKDILQ